MWLNRPGYAKQKRVLWAENMGSFARESPRSGLGWEWEWQREEFLPTSGLAPLLLLYVSDEEAEQYNLKK